MVLLFNKRPQNQSLFAWSCSIAFSFYFFSFCLVCSSFFELHIYSYFYISVSLHFVRLCSENKFHEEKKPQKTTILSTLFNGKEIKRYSSKNTIKLICAQISYIEKKIIQLHLHEQCEPNYALNLINKKFKCINGKHFSIFFFLHWFFVLKHATKRKHEKKHIRNV